MLGCNGPDDPLVNLRLKLVDKIRVDEKLNGATLAPFVSRSFTYRVPVDGNVAAPSTGTLDVRLLFRSLSPYFLRAMDAMKSSGPLLEGYADKLAPIALASSHVTF